MRAYSVSQSGEVQSLDISSAGDKGAMPCAPTKAFGQRIINFWRCLFYVKVGALMLAPLPMYLTLVLGIAIPIELFITGFSFLATLFLIY